MHPEHGCADTLFLKSTQGLGTGNILIEKVKEAVLFKGLSVNEMVGIDKALDLTHSHRDEP